ncbi:multiple sugar transport system permease [Enterococcus sp. AZ194]|uniref:carbohydrate ABC transporter permease n=1 Tax=Enterococcus sp. AZ194 TaxID=2774629 RepID=UPI003F278734
MNSNRQKNRLGLILTSPYLIFTTTFFIIPLGWSLWLGFTNWNLISPDFSFVGLSNFLQALKSKNIFASFVSTYKFLIVLVPLSFVMSLMIAVIVNKLPRFKGIYLVLFFLPYLSSGVVSSLIVKGILSYDSPINHFFRDRLGLEINWLGNPVTVIFVISFMIAWKMSGYYALILVSGLNSIDPAVYEAAEIDGASKMKQFFSLTMPLMYPALYTVLTLAVGLSFGIFIEAYQLTGGGPDLATNTWQLEIYNQAFVNLNSGYASAIAIIASVVTFATIGVVKFLMQKWGEKNGWS